MRFDILLLDLDGTLLDASDAIVEGVLELAAEQGLPVPDPDWARGKIGQPPHTVWEELGAADPQKLVDVFAERVLPRLAGRSRALPGVSQALPRLAAAGLTLAVATTRLTENAREGLQATGLADHIDFVAGRDLVTHSKPAPDVLLHALEAVGGRLDRALMIGDSDADVLAAHAAGIPCWAVLDGIGEEAALRQAGADLILKAGFAELPDRLGL
jgi:HAD superfamily hydrolase (TIGR01509 family)